MKKSLLALAVLSAISGVASAQSTVTLSGSVDVGVRRQAGAWNMATAGSSRSNFTLSGSEDLGGGMKAIFLLNHRFKPNDGSINNPGGASYFYRNSYVGLAGGFGDIRLGRILAPLQDLNGNFDPFGTDTVGSTHTGGLNAIVRATNAIYYRTPTMGGLRGHAMIAAAEGQISGEQGGGTPLNAERPMGFGVDYSAGPLSLAVMYDRNSSDQKTTGFYGKYNFGMATLMGQYERGDKNVTATTFDKKSRWSLGGLVPFGAATLKVGYTKWKDEDVKKFGIGVDYSMSKRTTLYSDIGKTSGNGTGATAAARDDANKAQFDVGINHKF